MAAAPKIFIFTNGQASWGDVIGCAMAEDGHVIAGHTSSSIAWLKHDMGLNGTWQHDKYAKHYPDGYELVDLLGLSFDDVEAHPGFAAAVSHYEKLNPVGSSEPRAE